MVGKEGKGLPLARVDTPSFTSWVGPSSRVGLFIDLAPLTDARVHCEWRSDEVYTDRLSGSEGKAASPPGRARR